MIWIDYAIICLVSIGLIVGLWRGFSLAVYAFVFWVLAVAIGLGFSLELSVFLEPYSHNALSKITAAFALLFLLTLLVGSLIRLILGTAFNNSPLSFTRRLGGLLIGAVHSLFTLVVVVMLAGLTALPDDLWWQESKLLPPFQACAVWLRDLVPSGLAGYIHYRSPQ
jgi:membrane protein required for colicin V production